MHTPRTKLGISVDGCGLRHQGKTTRLRRRPASHPQTHAAEREACTRIRVPGSSSAVDRIAVRLAIYASGCAELRGETPGPN